eukprot:3400112-Prymnesium_polylepis.1
MAEWSLYALTVEWALRRRAGACGRCVAKSRVDRCAVRLRGHWHRAHQHVDNKARRAPTQPFDCCIVRFRSALQRGAEGLKDRERACDKGHKRDAIGCVIVGCLRVSAFGFDAVLSRCGSRSWCAVLVNGVRNPTRRLDACRHGRKQFVHLLRNARSARLISNSDLFAAARNHLRCGAFSFEQHFWEGGARGRVGCCARRGAECEWCFGRRAVVRACARRNRVDKKAAIETEATFGDTSLHSAIDDD